MGSLAKNKYRYQINKTTGKHWASAQLLVLFILLSFQLPAQEKIRLNYPTSSGLMPLGTKVNIEVFRAGILFVIDTVIIMKNGMFDFEIPKKNFPGEFYLSFMAGGSKQSFPFLLGEKPDSISILINNGDIDFKIFGDNTEKKHREFNASVTQGAGRLRLLSGILRSFPTGSAYYSQTQEEYHKQVTAHNQKIDKATTNSNTWISVQWPLQKWPEEIKPGMPAPDFSFLPVKDSIILHTSLYSKYLNEQMRLAMNNPKQDSALLATATTLANKASTGHPIVYGWVIDYLQQGFEAIGFERGIKILGEHIQDANCLTSKKREIMYRLKGLESLKTGVKMPVRYLPNRDQQLQDAYQPNAKEKYRLLVFWAADCGHCHEIFADLFPWWKQNKIREQLVITTIDLGKNHKEWEQALEGLPQDALHLIAPSGISHPIANDYFILSTPIMFVVDKKRQIIAIPETFRELKNFFKNI